MDIDKLSEKEREELLSRLSAEKKLKEAAKRKNYQKMRNRFIASTEKRVRKYVKEGMALKKWLHDEADTFYNAMKGYGELKRDEQLGFTVGNDNFRIQVKGNRVKRFDERADIAEKRLIDYLNRWIQSKAREREIRCTNWRCLFCSAMKPGTLIISLYPVCTSWSRTLTIPNTRL